MCSTQSIVFITQVNNKKHADNHITHTFIYLKIKLQMVIVCSIRYENKSNDNFFFSYLKLIDFRDSASIHNTQLIY